MGKTRTPARARAQLPPFFPAKDLVSWVGYSPRVIGLCIRKPRPPRLFAQAHLFRRCPGGQLDLIGSGRVQGFLDYFFVFEGLVGAARHVHTTFVELRTGMI